MNDYGVGERKDKGAKTLANLYTRRAELVSIPHARSMTCQA